MRISKDEAIDKICRQKDMIAPLKSIESGSPKFKKWYRDTEITIQKIFGENTRHIQDFSNVQYSLMAFSDETPDSEWERAYRDGLSEAEALLASFADEIREYWEDAEHENDTMPSKKVEKICRRFHLIARQLRSRYTNRITLEIEDEYDVQDLLHSLLLIDFEDIRREEWTPSYAGGSARMDILLRKERIVIEVKKTRKGLTVKEIGDQLLVDIQRYKNHPHCKTLVCFIYDPEGRIGNPKGLANDLSKDGDFSISVIVAPSGE